MKPATRDRLLALNRQFYATVAEPFHSTRRSWPYGNVQLLQFFPTGDASDGPLRVLDAGCGNGRFAAVLDTLQLPVDYTGVDANPRLLELARESAAELTNVHATFVEADLSLPDWDRSLKRLDAGFHSGFDEVVCLSTLQHMPSAELRAQVLCSLADLLAAGGQLVVSAWQFLASSRLVSRRIAWSTVGFGEQDVEPGDALLPWKQDVYAVRYVHQIDIAEMKALAEEAQLEICHTYFADGKEGNLNLYAIMKRAKS
jgi:SAM-dependent methyltransferase